ncbi:hypothetical protein QFC19_002592 [Naganishia cerealis]|uniref:Uncharacterized protein n=1 Tax=Naganishia cerealis TaxID=610337 RepID=A0ACC2W9Y3_9TREE|nr:hypothetical protein QFC19_002592 [Naganishia cerealis]
MPASAHPRRRSLSRQREAIHEYRRRVAGRANISVEGVPGREAGVPGDPAALPPPLANAAKALLVQLELCGAAGRAMWDGALAARDGGTPDVVLDLERVGMGAARIGGGTRGGAAEFKWTDVKADKDRENYLGHSINAPQGRWQNNKDIHWYNRNKSGEEDAEALKRQKARELKEIKMREENELSIALGYGPVHDLDNLDLGDEGDQAQGKGNGPKTDREIELEKLEAEEKRRRKDEHPVVSDDTTQGPHLVTYPCDPTIIFPTSTTCSDPVLQGGIFLPRGAYAEIAYEVWNTVSLGLESGKNLGQKIHQVITIVAPTSATISPKSILPSWIRSLLPNEFPFAVPDSEHLRRLSDHAHPPVLKPQLLSQAGQALISILSMVTGLLLSYKSSSALGKWEKGKGVWVGAGAGSGGMSGGIRGEVRSAVRMVSCAQQCEEKSHGFTDFLDPLDLVDA